MSGNPTGKCKDGTIPEQDAPCTEARELVGIMQAATVEQVQEEIKRIYLAEAPELMRRAIQMAKSNDKIMAILVAPMVPRLEERRAPAGFKDRNQLELELQDAMEAAGYKVSRSQSASILRINGGEPKAGGE